MFGVFVEIRFTAVSWATSCAGKSPQRIHRVCKSLVLNSQGVAKFRKLWEVIGTWGVRVSKGTWPRRVMVVEVEKVVVGAGDRFLSDAAYLLSLEEPLFSNIFLCTFPFDVFAERRIPNLEGYIVKPWSPCVVFVILGSE